MNDKVIIWDWNGTLIDDLSIIVETINLGLARCKLKAITTAKYREIFRHPVIEMYRDVGLDLPRDEFEKFAALWHDEYKERASNAQLFSDALDVLGCFRDRGYTQVMLSASPLHLLEHQLSQHKLRHFFANIAGAENCSAKGKLDYGLDLMKNIGADRKRSYLLGDTDHDYEVAIAIGAKPVLIARGSQSKSRLEQLGCEIFDTLHAARDWILSN